MTRISPMLARTALTTAVTGALVLTAAGTAAADTEVAEPATFTSAFTAMATPDMVVNSDGVPTPGPQGASGTFTYMINSDEEIICYDISVRGITPPYESPAKTATHIHEASAGDSGPPRLAFPNPVDDGSGTLVSSGCLQGPFTTGVVNEGTDTGEGFSLAEIEANPSAFFTDTHTAANPAGAVRGQLTEIPIGGVETGAGATAGESSSGVLPAVAGLGVLAAAGAVALHRRGTAGR